MSEPIPTVPELTVEEHLDLMVNKQIRVLARVENYYIDHGDEIVTYPDVTLPEPPGRVPQGEEEITPEMDEWLQVHLFGMTGTGRTKGDATYDLEVIFSSRPDLLPVGYTHEWGY